MATDIEIFVGTSLDFLLSFKVKKNDDDAFVMERVIAHRCHNGSIICMDACGRYLATGGADDKIVVIDLKLNRDVHEIIRHEGTINSLQFTNKCSDLLSASEDGRLIATTVGSWKQSNIWRKPHTGKSVLKVCLHPSDKFALTAGKDGTLRGWDMFRGKQINTFNTKDLSEANIVLDNLTLCPSGNTFAMSGAKTVTLCSLIDEGPYDEMTLASRVTSMCWLNDENLLVGMENGSIEWANIFTSEHVNLPNIHTRRIKDMHHLNGFLGTVCTTGTVSLWATAISDKKLTLICSVTDESIRPTCIKMVNITENRYKEAVQTEATKADVPVSVKRSKRIQITGKVIVEMDSNDNNNKKPSNSTTISPNWKPQVSDNDAETEMVIIPPSSTEKKTPKKNRKSPSNDVVTPTTKSTPKSSNKKRKKVTPTKLVVVRSPNLDDDFETSPRSSKIIKTENLSSETVVQTKRPAKIKKRKEKSKLIEQQRNGSVANKKSSQKTSVDGTPKHKSKAITRVSPVSASVANKKSSQNTSVDGTPKHKSKAITQVSPVSASTISEKSETPRKTTKKNRKRKSVSINGEAPTFVMSTRRMSRSLNS